MTNYLGFICRANDILSLLKDNSDGIYLGLDISRGINLLAYPNKSNTILESLFPSRTVCTLNFSVPLLKSASELTFQPDPTNPKHYKLLHKHVPVIAVSSAEDYLDVVPSDSSEQTHLIGYNSRLIELSRIENHELIESVTYDLSTNNLKPIRKSTFDYTYYSRTAILKLLDLQFSSESVQNEVDQNIYFIFSGSKITSGSGLRQPFDSNTPTEHFTFKIQKFVDATDRLNVNNNNFDIIKANVSLDSPGTSFGIPCPPDWHPDE